MSGNKVLGRFKGLLGSGKSQDTGPVSDFSGQEFHEAVLLLQDYEASGLGWFWASDSHGQITYISDCVARLLGKDRSAIIGQPMQSLFILERDEDDQVERTLPLLLSARKTFADLQVRAAVEGREIWWSISGRPQFSADGAFTCFRGNGTDVTASRQSQKDASRLAQYDSLTGLANRHRMDKRLSATLTAY